MTMTLYIVGVCSLQIIVYWVPTICQALNLLSEKEVSPSYDSRFLYLDFNHFNNLLFKENWENMQLYLGVLLMKRLKKISLCALIRWGLPYLRVLFLIWKSTSILCSGQARLALHKAGTILYIQEARFKV